MKKPGKAIFYFYILAALIFILDQTTKFFIKKSEIGKNIIDFGFFSLTYVNNYGAGFSILQGQNWLFILIASAFILSVIFFYNKIEKHVLMQTGFGLILGGAFSNLIDRLSYGFVIDYLDFKIWPVFNIADSAITIGVILIIIYCLTKEKKSKKSKKKY